MPPFQYARITLTRYTTLYFLVALLACGVLVILQALTFADNTQAANIIDDILVEANITRGVPVFTDGLLQICDSIPQPGVVCTTISRQINADVGRRDFFLPFSADVERGRLLSDTPQVQVGPSRCGGRIWS